MKTTVKHNTSKTEAQAKVDTFLKSLIEEEFPNRTALVSPHRSSWQNSRVIFSYNSTKNGVPATPVSGSINVTNTEVTINMGLFSPCGEDTTESVLKLRLEIQVKFKSFFRQAVAA